MQINQVLMYFHNLFVLLSLFQTLFSSFAFLLFLNKLLDL